MEAIMTVAKQMDFRANIKKFLDLAFEGETIFIPRKGNKNVYIISQSKYEEFQKAQRLAEYWNLIEKSRAQIEEGNSVKMSLSELRSMEA